MSSIQKRIDTAGDVPLLDEENAFAFRRNNDYSVGYFDAVDKRVRVLDISHREADPKLPEAAANVYRRLTTIYHRRAPTDIPTGPGYCTGHGFIDEPAGKPEPNTELNLPFRSLKYPNLVFILSVTSANPNGPRDVKQLDNPNVVTAKDIKDMKGMGALGAVLSLGRIKKTYGPKPTEMAGQPARILGREYHHKGQMDGQGGGVGAAYEFEAQVLGEPGRTDRPAIKLQMAAALPDADKRAPGVDISRPALKGHQPPPYDEGLRIFQEVVKSVRVRPVVPAPAAPASRP